MARKNWIKAIDKKIDKLKELNKRQINVSVYQLQMNAEWFYESVRIKWEDCFENFYSNHKQWNKLI